MRKYSLEKIHSMLHIRNAVNYLSIQFGSV